MSEPRHTVGTSPETIQMLQPLLTMLTQVTCQAGLGVDAMLDIMSRTFDPCFHAALARSEVSHPHLREAVYRRLVKFIQRDEQVPTAVTIDINEVHVNYAVELGVGSYATVYHGVFRGQEVAIKVPHNNRQWSRKAILKELVFGLLLHHPHILQSLGALDLSKPRIVTPFMSHGHIGSYIRSAKPDLPSIYRLISEIAAGVAYMHSLKIVHGDLRVPNILVDNAGHVRISDFGKAGFNGSTAPSSAADMLGAPGYIAPELAVAPDDRDLDNPLVFSRPSLPSDIFAFGSACYEILAGSPPFSGIYPPRVYVLVHIGRRAPRVTGIPDDIWNLICVCWKHIPSERPTALDVVRQIQ
ncbi:hypothetical protein NLI96_g11488 [Meripilus lineatus]|uniref:Protein kinase domain-containing protein n=1 Tax=Meripilus lineatus TaxID=2056292 RepID=A0AAD5UT42_9APHY|nr:hypothetical protein NLI96_g11488 [Physisporinus lineatus]